MDSGRDERMAYRVLVEAITAPYVCKSSSSYERSVLTVILRNVRTNSPRPRSHFHRQAIKAESARLTAFATLLVLLDDVISRLDCND